ncbi:ArnT family glycosyltransferase [candidate division KSB1 bacterium]
MAKKKKDSIKKTKENKAKIDIWQISFLAVFIVISVYLLYYLSDKPFMSYSKAARYLWIIFFLGGTGILLYNIFNPIKFLKKEYLVISLLVLLSFGLLYKINNAIFLGGDSGHYIVLSKSLAEFKGMVNLHLPNPYPETLYGFGLPLLMAPFLLVFGLNLIAAKLVIVLCGIGFAYFTYLVFKKYIREEFALLLALVISYNYWFYLFSSVVMTEVPFVFFMMMSIYYIEKYLEDNVKPFSKYLFISSILVFFSYMIKPIGIGIFGAAFIYMLLFKRDWKKLAFFSGIFIFGTLLWNIRGYIHTGQLGYLDFLIVSATREGVVGARESTRGFGLLGNLFIKPFKIAFQGHKIFGGTIFDNILAYNGAFFTFVVLLIYTGFIYHIIKFRSLFDLSVIIIFYGIAVYSNILTPSRYYFALIPFIYFYLYVAIQFLLSRLFLLLKIKEAKKIIYFGSALIFSVLFMTNLVIVNKSIPSFHTGRAYDYPTLQGYYEAGQWIKENVPRDAILASRLNKEMYVYTGIKSINSRVYHLYDRTWTEDKGKQIIEDLKKLIIQRDVDYYVLDSTRDDSRMTRESLAKNPQVLNEIFEIVFYTQDQSTYILKVKEDWKEKYIQDSEKNN